MVSLDVPTGGPLTCGVGVGEGVVRVDRPANRSGWVGRMVLRSAGTAGLYFPEVKDRVDYGTGRISELMHGQQVEPMHKLR